MTLDDISNGLPNGFHDAELKAWTIDWMHGTASLELDIWTGDADAPETYQPASLILDGLRFWIIEPPDGRYRASVNDALTIDLGNVTALEQPPATLLPKTETGAFVSWLYVRQWNSFMYVAAEKASLHWQGADRLTL